MPKDITLPPIWLLGSSGYSAELAAAVGAGFAFAHHFSEHDGVAAMRGYRCRRLLRRTDCQTCRREAENPRADALWGEGSGDPDERRRDHQAEAAERGNLHLC